MYYYIIVTFIYMRNTRYSVGPKFFGTTAKKSWFDEGDRCAPGPGAHQIKLAGATSPPVWTVGKDTDRNAFLERHVVPNPSPDRYKISDLNKTHTAQPNFTIPEFESKQNPNKIDEGNSLDYNPKYNVPKQKLPDYSFGYFFERDYSSEVPSPTVYNTKKIDKKDFNKTQRSFSIANRPPPYGQEGKFPFPGKYNIGGEIGEGPKYSVGASDRPEYILGASSGKFYQLSGDMHQIGKGKTMGLLIQVPRNKDDADFPSPIKYNPTLPSSTKNIISYRSSRIEINDQALVGNPSPNNYDVKLLPKEQTISFPKQKRASPEPNDDPGVGTYQVQKKLGTTLGHMAIKLKKLTQFSNPASSAYDPKQDLTRPLSQRPINYHSDRVDFSKSITGAKVGPGVYQNRTKQVLSLGKIGKGPKFDPNRNKNPGPGSYEIPNGIGKLPKYCSGPKKLTTTGFSFIELERQRVIKQRSTLLQKKRDDQKIKEMTLNQKESEMTSH